MGGLHDFNPVRLVIYLAVLIYSCILHECAHVWVAWRLGDPTGKNLGRLTLDPRPHIDPFWTVILPLITWLSRGGVIGGPKPAPVNPLNFTNPRTGFMWTALAGPATNLLLAALGIGILWLTFAIHPGLMGQVHIDPVSGHQSWDITYSALFLAEVMFTNMMLAAFNLIPLPPLDGSRFLQFILGRRGDALFDQLQRLGMIPLMIAFYFVAPYALTPFWMLLVSVLARILPPEYAMALVNAYIQK